MTNDVAEIENMIGVFPKLFDGKFCSSIIEKFELVYNAGFGENHHWAMDRKDSVLFSNEIVDPATMGIFKEFLERFWSTAYPLYRSKYEAIDNCAPHNIYSCKIQRTRIGEGYHQWHFDASNRETANRILIFILYLNDVEEGGETEFIYTPKRVKPREGTLLLFPAGLTHTHRGNPPLSNTKYILTGWVEF